MWLHEEKCVALKKSRLVREEKINEANNEIRVLKYFIGYDVIIQYYGQ